MLQIVNMSCMLYSINFTFKTGYRSKKVFLLKKDLLDSSLFKLNLGFIIGTNYTGSNDLQVLF